MDFLVLSMKIPSSNKSLVVFFIHAAHILIPKYHVPLKKQESLEKCLRLDLRQAMHRMTLILLESKEAMAEAMSKKTQEA